MRATSKQLADLHGLLAEVMRAELQMCQEEGIPVSASTMGVIVQFLKNNNITAMPDDTAMATLKEHFGNLTEVKSEKAKAILQQAQKDPLLN